MPTKKITDLTQLTDLDATDSFVVNDSGAGADKRVEFSDLQSEVLNGAAIGTSTAITELQVDNLNLNGNTISSTDTNGNILIQPNGTGDTIINESGADSDFRVEGDTEQNLLFVDASTNRVGIGTSSPAYPLEVTKSQNATTSIAITNANTGTSTQTTLRLNNSTAAFTSIGYLGGSFTTSGVYRQDGGYLYSGGAGGLTLITGATQPIYFAINSAEVMRIDSSGNVGIGTTSPTDYNAATRLAIVDSVTSVLSIAGGTATNHGPILALHRGTTAVSYIGSSSAILGGTSDDLIIWESGANNIRFYTNSQERARITGNGLTFNGDTAAANALDDYEQGTFTPTIIGSTGAGTGTYTAQVGRYTKIGNKVTCEIYLSWTAHTGTGDMRISLPTTLVTASFYYATPALYNGNISLTANNVLTGFAATGTDFIIVAQYPVGGGLPTNVPMDTAGEIMATITYESA